MTHDVLLRIRRAVRERRLLFTDHALEEADADQLTLAAILDVLLYGYLWAVYTEDHRGTRYVIRDAVDAREAEVVCRFREDGSLLIIITVYVVQ